MAPLQHRGVVFDEEVARAIEQRLRADGFEVTVSRARFAGEDDDEDQPWAITTDAPVVALELLLDTHDGWLDDTPAAPSPLPPLDLPAEPRRRHRGD